jgi:hypothetical protein
MSVEYEAVAFSRPGETGLIPYLGVLWAAENAGIIKQINAWISPSTTSFISVMLICGYECFEIMEMLLATPELLQVPYPFKNPLGVGTDIGPLKRKISKMITSKIGKMLTLKDLSDKNRVTLVGVGFSLERQQVEYIHANSYPNMNLLDFICISFSTPGIYSPYKLENDNWIDGSVVEPFPISSIDLENGNILGITSKQNIVSMNASDPIGQVRNITEAVFESARTIKMELPHNVVMINIYDSGKSKFDPVLFETSLKFSVGETSDKIRHGWESFTNKHIGENEDEEKDGDFEEAQNQI